MKKSVIILTTLLVITTFVCVTAYNCSKSDALFTASISFGTVSYHFLMRLGVGLIFNKAMHNRADYTKKRYQCSPRELKLYERLHVKRWKNHMPTYDSALFNPKLHSWDEITQVSCQAELVHGTSALLSLFPILLSLWFGAAATFIITSLFAALFDTLFVIVQRYNRPRLIRMAQLFQHRQQNL